MNASDARKRSIFIRNMVHSLLIMVISCHHMKSIKTDRYQTEAVNIKPWSLFLSSFIFRASFAMITWSNPKKWNRSNSCDLHYRSECFPFFIYQITKQNILLVLYRYSIAVICNWDLLHICWRYNLFKIWSFHHSILFLNKLEKCGILSSIHAFSLDGP